MTWDTRNIEQYREQGSAAAKSGIAKHENPFDYRFETLAANAWDEGFEKTAKLIGVDDDGFATYKLPFEL